MNLSQLLSKRIIFISGKGGVGKTTVAILLAQIAASQKKNTLIVEMNSTGRVAPIFNKDNSTFDIISLAPKIDGLNLLPKHCFEEYVIMQIKFRALYNTFFNNKYVNNFVDAIPGLPELLMLGKIYDLERSFKNRLLGQKLYDLIIVDAPATGHGLSALEVPHIVETVVKVGPMHKNAKNMQEIFSDAEKTAFCLVTLAEEMPVVESVQYIAQLREKTDLHFGPIFVNAVMPEITKLPTPTNFSEELQQYWNYYFLTRKRSELNQHYLKEIESSFPDFEKIVLPFLFQTLDKASDFSELVGFVKEGAL